MLGLACQNAVLAQKYSRIHGLAYSAGEGHGGTYSIERVLDDGIDKIGDFGFGGIINLRTQNIEEGNRTEIIFAARVIYLPYIIENDRIDTYAFFALGLGFEDVNNDPGYVGPRVEEQIEYTAWGAGAGIRYNIFDRFGIFAEGSYGIGAITLGLFLRTY